MTLVFKGVHGTCVSHAESIIKNGIHPTLEGRAGAGVYLWSYINDASEAEHLAADWYADQLDKGAYSGCPKTGRVLLYYEIELEATEAVNINSTAHHELIRRKAQRARGKAGISKVYDDYLNGVSTHRLEKHGVSLKLVEASLPVPNSTRERSPGLPLTVGADAYIVLATGLPSLKLVEVVGMPWKGNDNA